MKHRGHKWRPPDCDLNHGSFSTRGRALDALREIVRVEAQAAVKSPSVPNDVERCGECGAWKLARKAN